MESRPMHLVNHSASQPGFAIAPVIQNGVDKKKQALEHIYSGSMTKLNTDASKIKLTD